MFSLWLEGILQRVSITFAKIGPAITFRTRGKILTAFTCSLFAPLSIIPNHMRMEFILVHTLSAVAAWAVSPPTVW
jgi:hypothetical protein